mmetsp:Transcript_6434/g.13504  ORF Transcript_6434/g.13504 Transcript_6434/m.13504 type:complete len:247 (+) Transcript_6434:562-1302(+)
MARPSQEVYTTSNSKPCFRSSRPPSRASYTPSGSRGGSSQPVKSLSWLWGVRPWRMKTTKLSRVLSILFMFGFNSNCSAIAGVSFSITVSRFRSPDSVSSALSTNCNLISWFAMKSFFLVNWFSHCPTFASISRSSLSVVSDFSRAVICLEISTSLLLISSPSLPLVLISRNFSSSSNAVLRSPGFSRNTPEVCSCVRLPGFGGTGTIVPRANRYTKGIPVGMDTLWMSPSSIPSIILMRPRRVLP